MKLLCLSLLALASAGHAQTIEVGQTDWSSLPPAAQAPHTIRYALLVDRVQEMLARKQCVMPGQKAGHFDIDVPYAVLLDKDGNVGRILVSEKGCEPLETMVGNVVADLAERGGFKTGSALQPGWYADSINLTLQ